MPVTEVFVYADDDGYSPFLDWLDALPEKVQSKCIVRVERLATMGYELRRPEADYLRDDIYELRIRNRRVNYRVLYFFSGRMAVISHGLRKEGKVPDDQIDLAIRHRELFTRAPHKHTYREAQQ